MSEGKLNVNAGFFAAASVPVPFDRASLPQYKLNNSHSSRQLSFFTKMIK